MAHDVPDDRDLNRLNKALGNNVGPYERHPTSLYDCAENLAVAIRSLSAATFCPAFRPLDIVKGNAQATMEILKYVREKFDVRTLSTPGRSCH